MPSATSSPAVPRLGVVILAAAVLAALLVLAPGPARAATSGPEKADEWRIWCWVNDERRAWGMAPLLMSVDLHTEMARPWSETQANAGDIFHRSNLGSATSSSVGSWDRAAENVGRYDNAANLHDAWMRSSGHAANILDRRLEYIGIGVTHVPGYLYGTQNFVSRSSTLPLSTLPLGQRFIDVCNNQPFFGDITWMYDTGVSKGYLRRLANGHAYRDFQPMDTVTRAAMAAFLHRVVGQPGIGDCSPYPFADVASNEPFRNQICWMHNRGITGVNTTFNPGAATNRQAMALWMYRLWLAWDSSHQFSAPTEASFRDVPPSSPFFEAIEWTASMGISTGYSDDTWRPTANVTRQAMAAFFHRYHPTL